MAQQQSSQTVNSNGASRIKFDLSKLSDLGTFDATTGIVLSGANEGATLTDYFTPADAWYIVAVDGNITLNNISNWYTGDIAYSDGAVWRRIPLGNPTDGTIVGIPPHSGGGGSSHSF